MSLTGVPAHYLDDLLQPGPTELVAVTSLRGDYSPRLDGERPDHVRMLAKVEAELPPILVHRATMRVIDGMHRLEAAKLRGAETIRARYFDGPDNLALALAIQANTRHGLPLSTADRERAAVRLLDIYPDWSDRAIAAVAGLAGSTVGVIRRRHADSVPQQAVRRGRDGRARPLTAAVGRRAASEFIAARPQASLREIARAAGISTATARDVRARIDRGDDPVPADRHPSGSPEPVRDPAAILHGLCSDPSLRFTDHGRNLLHWLTTRVVDVGGWEDHLERIPPHSAYLIAELARSCSQRWLELAKRLEHSITHSEEAASPRT